MIQFIFFFGWWLLVCRAASLEHLRLMFRQTALQCKAILSYIAFILSSWRKPELPEKKQQPAAADPFDLNTPLLYFSPYDVWTVGDSFQGTSVFGRTGSGKTTGSGEAIIKAFLRRGYGALFLCAKPHDCEMYSRYAKETGRREDVVIISADGKHRTNFMNYELTREDKGGGQTENILNLLVYVVQIVEKKVAQTGDSFWDRSMHALLRSAIDLISLSGEEMTLENICRFIVEAPESMEQVADENWRQTSFCAKCINAAHKREKTPGEAHDFTVSARYWLKTFPTMASRTRSGIVATFISISDVLMHGIAHEILCTDTTITPEASWQDGAIIIIDFSIQQYGEIGRIIQGVWKYLWQKAVLRRDSGTGRPLCLVCDEAQYFISNFDFSYQAVARSARAATLFMTQNISMYYSALGGNSRDEIHALLGNLSTLIFHANADPPTNAYAVDVISKERTLLFNSGASIMKDGSTVSTGRSEAILDKILPSDFLTLRTGGASNDLCVDAIIFKSGRIWQATGDIYMKVTFKQEQEVAQPVSNK